MSRVRLAILGLASLLAMTSAAQAQVRPHIGYVYPAGGQQGTTFQIRLGGQNLDDVSEVLVSGTGVQAKVVEYYRKLGPQELTLLREQLNELKRSSKVLSAAKSPASRDAKKAKPNAQSAEITTATAMTPQDEAAVKLAARIEKRMAEYVQTPACASISSLVFVEITMTPDASPGARELTLVTPRGVSNPLVFHVGQVPETSRKPMLTALLQVLGKEETALRKRPDDEVEVRISVPCTMNGQIASGEVNRYRFEARKGQRLVISTQARQLIPYIADAVPGWFQPVMALYDARGKEVAYSDDYRFKPDPVILFEVPRDGEYVLSITDAIYRGREDFVYRITIGELPFLTSIFPLGGRVGATHSIEMKGWNLQAAKLTKPASDAEPEVYPVTARKGKLVSNPLPFALDTLPECFDQESNNDPSHAQKVKLPIIVNGRIDRADDWDVFEITGRAGDTMVAEVSARRLESPLDSLLKFTDSNGKVLAFNDDREDPEAGVNTHHADSYLMVKLPADGTYYVHLGDTARNGGEEYAYRLRISAPRPDFALFVVPSSTALRSRSSGTLNIQAVRKDGFTGPIKLALRDPPAGLSSTTVSLSPTQTAARLSVKTGQMNARQRLHLAVEGRAKIGESELAHEAVPAEDKMQAFLWRHLVPAKELKVLVFDPSYVPAPKRRSTRGAARRRTETGGEAGTYTGAQTAIQARREAERRKTGGGGQTRREARGQARRDENHDPFHGCRGETEVQQAASRRTIAAAQAPV